MSPTPLTPPTPPTPQLDLPDPVPTLPQYPPILSIHENSREEELGALRVVDEILLDEDGEETEYAEFTMDDLEQKRADIKAEISLLDDDADTAPDHEKAAKDV